MPRDNIADPSAAIEYLEHLYAGAAMDGFISTWTKQSNHVEWFSLDDLLRLSDYMLDCAPSSDIYHSWCIQKKALGSHRRGRSESVIGSPGVFFDADLKSDVHSKSALPESYGQVIDWIRAESIPYPSQIRSSGNGLYLDWIHQEPVFFETEEARVNYARQVRSFHVALRKNARRKRGWDFDATHDLPRVTRMPGTLNHKTSPAKKVEIIDE
ncbi:hypothetical protein [Hyphobacterium indicum]|uniref:hypothetical protein n=1 Tax=Hyphobacterium indicum TaxID=2162714 RepID=UPI000F644720|nr:hypothetical protein [Hyphobacterium indicum]